MSLHKESNIKSFFKRANAALNWFIGGDFFIVFIAAVVFLSWAANLVIASIIVLLVAFACVAYTQKTLLPLAPMLIMFSFMIPDNFIINMAGVWSYWYIGAVAALPVSGVVFFFIKNKRPFKKSRFFWPSMAFCAALICSGLFSPYYAKGMNFLIAGGLAALYLFFTLIFFNGTEKIDFQYLAKCLFVAAAVVALQITVAYFKADSIRAGLMTKETTRIGWGISNTAAIVLSMCVPAAFYLAAKSKYNYLYLAGAAYFIIAILFTKSRGGVLVTALLLPLSVCFCVKQTPKERRKSVVVTMLSLLAAVIFLLLVFWDEIGEAFLYLGRMGLDDTGRFDIYKDAVKSFFKYPAFGIGWYPVGADWISEIGQNPYRIFYNVHNIVLQYIASGGVFLIITGMWLFGKRYLAFYADWKPQYVFFLAALISHGLCICFDSAIMPYCIVIACLIFTALEKDVRQDAEAAKKKLLKQEKFYF